MINPHSSPLCLMLFRDLKWSTPQFTVMSDDIQRFQMINLTVHHYVWCYSEIWNDQPHSSPLCLMIFRDLKWSTPQFTIMSDDIQRSQMINPHSSPLCLMIFRDLKWSTPTVHHYVWWYSEIWNDQPPQFTIMSDDIQRFQMINPTVHHYVWWYSEIWNDQPPQFTIISDDIQRSEMINPTVHRYVWWYSDISNDQPHSSPLCLMIFRDFKWSTPQFTIMSDDIQISQMINPTVHHYVWWYSEISNDQPHSSPLCLMIFRDLKWSTPQFTIISDDIQRSQMINPTVHHYVWWYSEIWNGCVTISQFFWHTFYPWKVLSYFAVMKWHVIKINNKISLLWHLNAVISSTLKSYSTTIFYNQR